MEKKGATQPPLRDKETLTRKGRCVDRQKKGLMTGNTRNKARDGSGQERPEGARKRVERKAIGVFFLL